MRIQVLPLPSQMVGEVVEEPFSLIVDQLGVGLTEVQCRQWSRFTESCGARAVAFHPDTVEVVDRYAEPASEPVMRPADPVVPPREFDAEERLAAFETALRVLEGVSQVRALQEVEKAGGLAPQAASGYQRGYYNGLEMALAVLEDRVPEFREGPAEDSGSPTSVEG